MKTFLVSLCLGAMIAAAALGGAAWWAGRRVSAAVESELRREVFADPARGGFDSAGVDWLGPRLYVRGLRLKGLAGEGWSADAEAREVSVPVAWRSLLDGNLSVKRVDVLRPALSVRFSTAPAAVSAAPAALSGAWLARIEEFGSTGGTVELSYPGGKALTLEGVSFEVKRPQGFLAVHAEGRLSGDRDASLRFDARLDPAKRGNFEGELRFAELPIPLLAGLFPADPDVALQSGKLSLSSQFNCRNDWLTASHLVEIKGFKAAVAPGRKELFGISLKYLAELLDIDHLSFVVPMNGAASDPHIGVASSVQQILLKLLEEKFKDREKAEKWARWGGDHFGAKIDRALRDWRSRR